MRPLLNYSIDQLETEYDRARQSGDRAALDVVAYELSHRRTPRAKDLQDAVGAALSELGGPPENAPSHTPSAPPSRASKQSAVREKGRRPKPTEEQLEAVDRFGAGGALKINAYAGAGKTSTLELLAHGTKRRGQYIAFNRAIVASAKERFPDTVNCSTTHGLAFKSMAPRYGGSPKMTERLNANQLADLLDLRQWRIDKDHTLRPRSQGFLIIDTIKRFCQSADKEPSTIHVPHHGSLVTAPPESLELVHDFAVRGAKHVWARMADPNDTLPLGHDGYLKLWALSEPEILGDFILMDEAQDTNPVVLDVLQRQAAQIVYVGDKYQQIYEWRGAVNAMDKIATPHTVHLTQSFRFGPAIAEAANAILSLLGEKVPLRGNPSVQSRITDTSAAGTILARTNSSTIAAVIDALDQQLRPHLVGGTTELMQMLRGVQDLKNNLPSAVPDFFGFENWQEVVEFAGSGEGDHLQTFVNLVQARGERQLMWALNRAVEAAEADVIISTAHKAKGEEWATVTLLDDFLRSRSNRSAGELEANGGFDESELRLFYVAITRAKEALCVPSNYLALLRGEVTEFHHAPEGRSAQYSAHQAVHALPATSQPPRRPEWTPPRDFVLERDRPAAPPRQAAQTSPAPVAPAPTTPRRKGLWSRLFE